MCIECLFLIFFFQQNYTTWRVKRTSFLILIFFKFFIYIRVSSTPFLREIRGARCTYTSKGSFPRACTKAGRYSATLSDNNIWYFNLLTHTHPGDALLNPAIVTNIRVNQHIRHHLQTDTLTRFRRVNCTSVSRPRSTRSRIIIIAHLCMWQNVRTIIFTRNAENIVGDSAGCSTMVKCEKKKRFSILDHFWFLIFFFSKWQNNV